MKSLLLLFPLLVFANVSNAERFYVDADAAPGGDGSSWATAYKYLQDALDQTVAGRGDEVWIAQGTYYPDDGVNVTEGDRTASFPLRDGVTLYGGFKGSETLLSERDWETYNSVLSGRIFTEHIYWSLRVCTVEDGGAITLDGLTVTGGNANGTGTDQGESGAIYSPSWRYEMSVTNSTFSGNSASYGGVASRGDWTVTNSTFSNNSASYDGGVAYSSNWTVTNSTFSNNSASYGGGVASSGDWTVTNSTFSNNSASYGGVASSGDWTVTNSTFSNNSASYGGGVASYSDWTVTNSTFSNNSASYGGGVAYNSDWAVGNSIFASTNSSSHGTFFDEMARFHNITDPVPTPLSERGANLIQGGLGVINIETGGVLDLGVGFIIDADPLFVAPSDPDGPDDIWGTADDGLRLQAGSPAIAQGNTALLPDDSYDIDDDGVTGEPTPLDLAGFLRVQDESLDLGAYEYGNSTIQLYSLSSQSSEGGTVDPSGIQNYVSGSSEVLTATPSGGYLFDGWTGDASGSVNPLTVSIDHNLSITATFTPDLADPDNDGLTNFQEIVTYGTNPNIADTNGDDFDDGDVVAAGFDPNTDYSSLLTLMGSKMEDARSGSTMIDVSGGNALLRLQIERSADLLEWSKNPEDVILIEIPLGNGNEFFRFAFPQE